MEKTTKNVNGNFLRTPPASVEAEQAVLSAILANNKVYEDVSEFLLPKHFVELTHQKIYEACQRLIEKGHLADIITLKNYLESNGILEQAGGINYLSQLASSSISVINVMDYAKLVYECAIKRELIDIGTDIVNDAFGGSNGEELSSANQIEKAESELYTLSMSGNAERGPVSLQSSLTNSIRNIEEAYKAKGTISGLSTGLTKLDTQISGLNPSNLLILAGRPSMGKTALALNIAFNAANEVFNGRAPKKLNGPVIFFSLEMSADELSARLLSNSAEVNSQKLRDGRITEEEFDRLVEHQRAISDLPLFIDDTPAISVPMIRARARRLKRQFGGLALIVIDYIQLIASPSGKKSDNRVQEVSEISRGLKILAKELEVPVLALSQLSRAVEQRKDADKDATAGKPKLSDLRDSGSIEQDADCVMFIYRESYYHERKRPLNKDATDPIYVEWEKHLKEIEHVASVLVEKQRHGPIGEVKVSYVGDYCKFGNLYNGTTEG